MLLQTGKVKQEPTVYREGPPYQRRGSLQLWQFLVTLLDDPANSHFIAWTGRGMEFKLIEPEEVKTNKQNLYITIMVVAIISQISEVGQVESQPRTLQSLLPILLYSQHFRGRMLYLTET